MDSLNNIGVFTKIGDCIMMVQKLESTLVQDSSHVSKKIKLEDGSQGKIIQTDMYVKKDTNKIISVDPNTFMPLENQNLEDDDDLKGRAIKDLIDQGILVKVGSKSETAPSAAEPIKKEKDIIKVETKKDKDEQEEFQDENEIAKLDDSQEMSSTKNAFNDEKVVTLDDDDDDEDGGRDELLDEDDDDQAYTSDESSESNDESSDDPDYFGTRAIKEWKSTSNRAAKKKRKLLKKKERDEMRAQRRLKGERSGGRGRKPGKSSIAVKDEAKLCLEATKKMLDVEVLEVGSTFSISNLSERQVGPRGCIVYVMRVLRGFKMLSQIKSEEPGDTQYKWKGLNMDDLKEQIRNIFEKDETSEDVVWNITRDMIKTFASSRKVSHGDWEPLF